MYIFTACRLPQHDHPLLVPRWICLHIWSLEPLFQNNFTYSVIASVHRSKYRSTTRLCLKPTICLFFKQTAVSIPHRLLSYNTVVLARGPIFAQPLHNHLFFVFFNFLCYHGNLAPAAMQWCTLYPSLKSNNTTINMYCFHKTWQSGVSFYACVRYG